MSLYVYYNTFVIDPHTPHIHTPHPHTLHTHSTPSHTPHSTPTHTPHPHRAYLKNVAKKLADDVDNLKSNASTLGRQKEEWMERRTLKRDKGGNLELQLQLKNEMSEKAKTQEQLTQITAQMAEMESYVWHDSVSLVTMVSLSATDTHSKQ